MTKTKQEFDKLLHKSRKWCKVYIGFSSFEYCKEIKKYENILTYILVTENTVEFSCQLVSAVTRKVLIERTFKFENIPNNNFIDWTLSQAKITFMKGLEKFNLNLIEQDFV
jgi:hypothetical protein